LRPVAVPISDGRLDGRERRASMAAMKVWLGAALMTGGLSACSAQVEPDYLGEPLAVVRGAVVTGDEAPPSEVDAALIWASEPDEGGWPIARVRVRGEFPAQFTIEVLDPPPPPDPPPDGLEAEEPDPTAVGLLAAIAPNSGDRISYDEILGVWLGGGVVYFWRDANGTENDWVLYESEKRRVPATKGYHLFRQTISEQTEAEYFRCTYFDLCEQRVYTDEFGVAQPDWPGSTRYAADRQALLEGTVSVERQQKLSVVDSDLSRVEYARLVRKGRHGREFVHGPLAATASVRRFRTARGSVMGPFWVTRSLQRI
jgi:hypothetical protein